MAEVLSLEGPAGGSRPATGAAGPPGGAAAPSRGASRPASSVPPASAASSAPPASAASSAPPASAASAGAPCPAAEHPQSDTLWPGGPPRCGSGPFSAPPGPARAPRPKGSPPPHPRPLPPRPTAGADAGRGGRRPVLPKPRLKGAGVHVKTPEVHDHVAERLQRGGLERTQRTQFRQTREKAHHLGKSQRSSAFYSPGQGFTGGW